MVHPVWINQPYHRGLSFKHIILYLCISSRRFSRVTIFIRHSGTKELTVTIVTTHGVNNFNTMISFIDITTIGLAGPISEKCVSNLEIHIV